MTPEPAWRPIAGLSVVLILFCALFFVAYPLTIAPRYAKMFADFGASSLPLLTRVALKPATSWAALLFLAGGTAGGLARPEERTLILSLTAGGGIALCMISMLALYLPIFVLAGAIE